MKADGYITLYTGNGRGCSETRNNGPAPLKLTLSPKKPGERIETAARPRACYKLYLHCGPARRQEVSW